ncbi:hypothetical protein ACFYRC_01950 [Streptomyces sp. NPDC005279]|uniref:hypothetical protein n=1 Tax=Streptomyces sp. NPDC005279 TaxID=3364712 RepID=UPI003678A67F
MSQTSQSPAAQAAPGTPPSRIRMWSVISAALLIPAVIAAGILRLATEHGSRCLTYGGPDCSSWPQPAFAVAMIGAGVACVVTIAIRARTRQARDLRTAAFVLQILLEIFAVALSIP